MARGGPGWGTAGRHPEGEQGGRGATPPPHTPPTGTQAAGAPAPTPRGRGDGPPCPRLREEPECGAPPRPSRRLPQEPRRTSEPAPTRQDAAQIAPSEGGRAQTGVVWGATPPMDRTTPVTPALLPAQGRQRDGTRQSDPPPYSPPPAHECHGPAPRHAAPTGRAGQGDRVGPPHPHARAHSTWIADPKSPPSGRAVGEGGRLTPDAPRNSGRHPRRGRPSATPTTPSQAGGNQDRTAHPQARQTEQGTGEGHAEGHGPCGTALPAPSAGTARGGHATQPRGGGADAAGARAHTHAKGTRGLPEGQPDRARGTHRPRGMAYQRARVRDTRTGRPATRSAGHTGREGGNGRDTTPGTADTDGALHLPRQWWRTAPRPNP